jgi:hypothetical protein
MAHGVISRPRNNQVAFGEKRTLIAGKIGRFGRELTKADIRS